MSRLLRPVGLRHVAVVKGQLTAGHVAADQQVMLQGGGAQPHPPIPALALRAGPRGADLPAVSIVEQAGDRLGAGERDPGARVRRKLEGTRSTYPWLCSSQNARSSVQLP